MSESTTTNNPRPRVRVVPGPETMSQAEIEVYQQLTRAGRMMMRVAHERYPGSYQTLVSNGELAQRMRSADRTLSETMLRHKRELMWRFPPKGTGTMDRMRQEGAVNEMLEEQIPELIEQVLQTTLRPDPPPTR